MLIVPTSRAKICSALTAPRPPRQCRLGLAPHHKENPTDHVLIEDACAKMEDGKLKKLFANSMCVPQMMALTAAMVINMEWVFDGTHTAAGGNDD